MNTIVAIPSKTIREIARELRLPVYFRQQAVPDLENVIRWGSTRPLTISGRELNTAEAIARSSDKGNARLLLAEQGIAVPKKTESQFPLVARTSRHSQGSGFYLCHNEYDVERAKRLGATYFSQFYPKQNEYRVHIGSGKCLLMSVKEGDKSAYVWNKRKSNFTFRHLRRSVWLEDDHLRNMVRASKKAVAALGLDFGAVDVLADAEGDYPPFVVSEVNTSPALSPLAVKKYATYFATQLGLPYDPTD